MVAQVDAGHRLRKTEVFQLISTRQLFFVGFLVLINTTEMFYFDFIFIWGDLSKIQNILVGNSLLI